MMNSIRRSIALQLILGITLLNTILMSVFISEIVFQHKDDLENHFTKNSFDYAKLLAGSSIQWVLSSDFQALEELVTNSDSEEIYFLEIIDKHGRVLAHTDKSLIGKYINDPISKQLLLKKEDHIFYQNNKHIVFAVPVKIKKEIIGWVRLSKSEKILQKSIQDIFINGLFFVLASILISVVVTWFLIKSLTQDINKLKKFTTTYSDKKVFEPLELDRVDELQVFAETLNDLILRVEKDTKELSEKNTFLDLALEGSDLGIWDWNLINNSVRFDSRWASMLGLDVNKIKMELSTWETRVHPDDLDSCYSDIKAYMEGRSDHYQNVHRMKHVDGSWVYILDRGRFSEWDDNGKPIRFTGTHYNITYAQNSYESKIEEFNQIMSATPLGLLITTKEGVIQNINQQGRLMLEIFSRDIMNLTFLEYVTDEYKEIFKSFLENILSNGNDSLTFQIKDADENLKWLEASSAPFNLPNKQKGIITILNDITDKINQENELEIQQKITMHQSKLASLGELAASVGHEINNPLSIIKGYTQNLEKILNSDDCDHEKLVSYTAKIKLATERILGIVLSLRNYARIDNNTKEEFHPKAVILETYDLLYEMYLKDRIELEFDCSTQNYDSHVFGDKGKLQQVIMNILSNAKDALVGKDKKRIKVCLKSENNNFLITIADNGAGIPLEIKDKILEPYFTTKGVDKGTGIGLYLSNKFIKEMQGSLKIESVVGKGTTFIIQLPCINSVKNIFNTSEISGKTILIADDEKPIRDIFKELLEPYGSKIIEASDGEEVLNIINTPNSNIDVMIIDIVMPGTDGNEVVKKAAKLKVENKKLKIIAISGVIGMDFENKDNPIHDFIDGHIYKPFDEETALRVISSTIEIKAA